MPSLTTSLYNSAGMSRGAALGCSMEANAISGTNWTNGGWVAWMRRYSKGAIDLPMSRVFATLGHTSTQILNDWLAPMLASKPVWCFIDPFPNDPSTGVPAATSIANATAMITQCQQNGIFPILVATRIFGSGYSGWTATLYGQYAYLNQWIKDYCVQNSGVTYLDVNAQFQDFETGYSQNSLIMADNLHDNARGAQLTGLSAWNLISSLLPARDSRFLLLFDTYDAVVNPTGNLLTNGLMAGTTGTIAGGSTTVPGAAIAKDWNVFGGSTVGCAASKTAYPGYTNLFKQTFTLSGTADGSEFNFYQNATGWKIGDTVTAQAEADWNITSGAVDAVFVGLFANSLIIASDGYHGGSYGNYNTGAGQSILLRSDPVVIPPGTTTIGYALGWRIGAGAINTQINFALASLRKAF